MWYAIAAIVVAAVGFVVFLAVQFKKSGRTAAEVATSRQTATNEAAQVEKVTAINRAANNAPVSKDDFVKELQEGKEGQSK